MSIAMQFYPWIDQVILKPFQMHLQNEVQMETTSESKEEEVPCKQNEEQAATEAPAAESEKEQIKNAEEKATGEKKEDN